MFDSKYTTVHNYIFQEVNGKINSLRTFYSNELKTFLDGKKTGAALDDTYELNGPISLKLICSFAPNKFDSVKIEFNATTFDSENVSNQFDQTNFTVN